MNEINDLSRIKKDDALDILDRTIGFINFCDSKTSVFLGIFGVLLTILFSSDGVKDLKAIIKLAISSGNCYGIIFVIVLACTVIVFTFGIIKLLHVLFPQMELKGIKQEDIDFDSKIFFGSICKNTKYKQYREKLMNCSGDEYLNDIISQVYLNSIICNKKYCYFKIGLMTTIIGFLCFLTTWGIGIIIY